MATREERRKERERRFETKHHYWWSIQYRHINPAGRIPPAFYDQQTLTPRWMRYNSWKKLLQICTPKGKKTPLVNVAVRYAETLDRRLSRDYFCSGYDGQDVDYGDDLHDNLYEGLPVGKEEAEQIMKGVNLRSEWYVDQHHREIWDEESEERRLQGEGVIPRPRCLLDDSDSDSDSD